MDVKLVARGGERRQAGTILSADVAAAILGTLAFLALGALALREPTVAFGKTIGFKNIAVILGLVLVSVLLSCIALQLLIDRQRWSLKVTAIFSVLMFTMSAALSDGLLKVVDSRWPLAESVVQAKIEFFCLTNYNAARCVDQINLCPQCARELPPEARKDLKIKLAAFDAKLEAEEKKRGLAAEGPGPLSEATEEWRKKSRLK